MYNDPANHVPVPRTLRLKAGRFDETANTPAPVAAPGPFTSTNEPRRVVLADGWFENRVSVIHAALDDWAILQHTQELGDVAALLGSLEAYHISPFPGSVRVAIDVVDSWVLMARATCWRMMDKSIVAIADVYSVGSLLESALSRIEPLRSQ